MTELCNEIWEDNGQNYKWQRREKKRKKSLEALDKKNKKKNTNSVNTRKNIFIVNVVFNDKDHSFEILANKYVGHPDEFKEIKQMCINRYGKGVRVISIETK